MLSQYNRPGRIELVGCGGTGARLAEMLCRMIVGFDMPGMRLRLWDGDRVEQANIARQSFEPCEIGANKAQALALRLSGRFGLSVEAVGHHMDEAQLRAENAARHRYGRMRPGAALSNSLVITATDNLPSRRMVARTHIGWWLDVGNGLSAGQAVLGCTHYPGDLRRAASTWGHMVIEPLLMPPPWSPRPPKRAARPVYQLDPADAPYVGMHRVEVLPDLAGVDPTLMTSRKAGPAGPSCAAMPFSVQGFGVNDMAAMAAAALAKGLLVDGTLVYGAVFFDAAAGRMTPRPITREWYQMGRNAK